MDQKNRKVRIARHALVLVSFLLTSIALWTCIRIEQLNRDAGHVLPGDEEGKWRHIPPNEQFWRRGHLSGDNWAERSLTPEEQKQMMVDIHRYEKTNELRNLVGGFGVLQYPLLFVNIFVMVFGLTLSVHTKLFWWFITFLVVTCVCFWRMVALAYLPSLGW